MTNDSRIDKLQAAFDSRTERRDGQISQLQADVQTHDQSFIAVEARLAALESVKKPSPVLLAGPAIAAVLALGAFGSFVLSKEERVHEGTHQALEQKIVSLQKIDDDVKGITGKQGDKMDDVRQRLSSLEARAAATQNQVNAIDTRGTRRAIEVTRD